MQQTTNYNLKKIELTDSPPDITVINPNWDAIDTELKAIRDADAAHKAEYTNHISTALSISRKYSRDASITGKQIIEFDFKLKPDAYIIFASTSNSYSFGVNGVATTHYRNNSGTWRNGDAKIVATNTDNLDRTLGSISNLTNNGMEIDWVHTGVGAIGTIEFSVLFFFHKGGQ